ncbi:MAG: glycine oxidase ThiO [Cyanobacteria bacterium J083]|nr:MAG: glycine oxidase ThiO [Cyanobacteria bacterium J083]
MNAENQVIVIGGGIIGLATAIELQQQGAKVIILSRDMQEAAAHAAAGMLAPLAEGIPAGAMLDLALKSRWLYPEWIEKLERLTGIATGYFPCGILCPRYSLPVTQDSPNWLDQAAIRLYEPDLGEQVVGGYWYAEDGQVDNRQLVKALLQAAQSLGIEIKEKVAVNAMQIKGERVEYLLTNVGKLRAERYILATGSWASELLPIPVRPIKGQMMAVRMPKQVHQPLPLKRVLFGEDSIYLVPRQDGRLIVGATVEEVNWQPHNTAQGIQTLLNKATKLYPAISDWTIEEFWWGFRPGTPDELPILGTTSYQNLILATGHHRNGILLAPVTAKLIADLVMRGKADPLLSHFSCDRFFPKTSPPSTNMTSIRVSQLQPLTTPALDEPHQRQSDFLTIAGKQFTSRLMTGTGKYPSIPVMQESVVASGCEIVTVAVRRVQTQAPGHEGLAEALDWQKIWMLPNTAGCQTAEEAVRVARLGREMAKLLGQVDNNFIKLEVIPDPKYLLPDPIGTLQAAEQLVKEGFAVLPYINADPLLAKRLEEIGCATVMPLGSPIGSGQGIKNEANIKIIIEQSNIPVVVDAGIGSPSEAALAMELGADAVLINSAIALAQNPAMMAKAMGLATIAGRLAYLAGRIPIKSHASASSPLTGTVNS